MRAGGADSPAAVEALAELCGTYWYPLYAYVRRRGHVAEEAQDLVQAFFARLLEKNSVADARQEKGKFRAFLLVALKRFLADEWGRERAQKRGGYQRVLSIDRELAESRLQSAMADGLSPDVLFERQWAMALLDKTAQRLRDEYTTSGREALFDNIEGCMTKYETAAPYAEIATRLGSTVPAVKMAVQRLRRRYRELLREEIGKTVTAEGEIEGEIRHLFSLFGT